MNAAVRAVTRMGIYVGAKVYLINEVNKLLHPAFEPIERKHWVQALFLRDCDPTHLP